MNDDKFVLSKKILKDIFYVEYKKYSSVQLFLNNETLKKLGIVLQKIFTIE